jgi:hypothetical protein
MWAARRVRRSPRRGTSRRWALTAIEPSYSLLGSHTLTCRHHRRTQICDKLILRLAQPLGSGSAAVDASRAAAIGRACGKGDGGPAPELQAAACRGSKCGKLLCRFILEASAAATAAEYARRVQRAAGAGSAPAAQAGWQPVERNGKRGKGASSQGAGGQGQAPAAAAAPAPSADAAVPPPSAQGDLLAANLSTRTGAAPLKPPAPPAASPKRAAAPTEAASVASPATGAKQRRLAVDGETGSEVDLAAAAALPSSPDPHGQGSERAMEIEPAAAAATPKAADKWVQEQAMVLPAVGGWSVPADQPAAIALPTDGATTSAAASLAMLVCDRLGRRLALAGLLDEVGDEDKAAVPGVMTVLAQHGHVRTLDGSGGPAPMETCTHVVFLTAGEAA